MEDSFRNSGQGIGVPTLQMLNPELYKEMQKAEKQSKDPVLLSVRNLKERHGYQELRMQRIQKRTEEMTRELEHKKEEQEKEKRLAQMRASQQN